MNKEKKEIKPIAKINKFLKARMQSKEVLKKPERVTIHIKEAEPAEYHSIFFKPIYDNEKRRLLRY